MFFFLKISWLRIWIKEWNGMCKLGIVPLPMSILLIIAGGLILIGLSGLLVVGSRGSREGYEDELGFHHGPEPRRRAR